MRSLVRVASLAGAVLLALLLPAAAQACSSDDTAYFDGLLDDSCLELPLSNTEIDTFGGLRLSTNGTPVSTVWDVNNDFNNGITWDSVSFPPGIAGLNSLAVSSDSLVLPDSQLPLTRDAANNPEIEPPASTVLDNDNVDDPTVAKVGSTYMMWYAGTAEDGTGPAIFLATSTDGVAWTKQDGLPATPGVLDPVLGGDPGAFDEHGTFGPEVIHDASDLGAPFKMWYSGTGGTFGAIGYATSSDGITWTKVDADDSTPGTLDPVLDHGAAGAPDSFAAADPSVLKDGTTWKMWYTGDDSNKKRIAYATSPDGVDWSKGGKVIAPEDPGTPANLEFGAYAPTVWKSGGTFEMLFTGRKIVGGNEFQTKLLRSSSADGISWPSFSTELNESANRFDGTNLGSPEILQDPATATPFKLYYGGNSVDANGNFHTRIGLATSTNGTSFSKVNPTASCGTPDLECVLDIGTTGTAFDSRQASGLSVVLPGAGNYNGFYWGNRGSDFKPRLGDATSSNGGAWAKTPGTAGDGNSILPLSPGTGFDSGGQRDPSALYDPNALGADDYFLYYTALDTNDVSHIGFARTEQNGSSQPDNSKWTVTGPSELPFSGGSFDAGGRGHPSIVKDPANYVLYYTGYDNSLVPKIARTTTALANGPDGAFGAGAALPAFTGTATCDPDGQKDPTVIYDGGTYRMLYIGLEVFEGKTTQRLCYATSGNGTDFTRQGFALNPSQEPFSEDEVGVEPTGFLNDSGTAQVYYSGVDRTGYELGPSNITIGRTRGDHATGSFVAGKLANGWSTYQVGNETTDVQDWRQIISESTNNTVSLWMSFEQPYSTSGSGDQFWSSFFPVEVDTAADLNFLLTIRGVRWQARLSDPASNPSLDRVEITHAPVQFATPGSAVTKQISPPAGVTIASWGSLTVNADQFKPTGSGTASGTIAVLDAAQNPLIPGQAMNLNGDTTINLSGISPAANSSLRVSLGLVSDNPFTASPLVRSLKVSYSKATAPPAPAPIPTPAAPTATCRGLTATIVGTAGTDVLVGTPAADVIAGLDGNDTISGLAGNDKICGGNNDDRLSGGGGTDKLYGEAGNDRLAGSAGKRDLCSGGAGRRDKASKSCEKKKGIP